VTYSEFSKLADILNESVLADKRYGQTLDNCVSCGMLFGFWKDVVGKRFEKISIPYDLKNGVLFVSVISPVVTQELSMYKADIIKKYEPYAKGLNLEIFDIRFVYKNWPDVKNAKDGSNASKAFDSAHPEYYTEKDYETIGFDKSEEEAFQKVWENFEANKYMPESLKKKLYNNVVIQYKAQKLRKIEKEQK